MSRTTPADVCLAVLIGLSCLGGNVVAGEQAAAAAPQRLAREILQQTGVQGGLVVHVGCGDGRLTAELGAGGAFLVQGLDGNAEQVEAARRYLQSLGRYGKVSFDRLTGLRLPYVDSLVNLLVVEDANLVPQDEMMRVLAPQGVAYVKGAAGWTKTVKPVPAEIDEWTHYLYDSQNNAVSHDALVGPPRHLQWISGPDWSRHHDHMASLSAMVSAGGRVFYILDEGPREAILLPAKWSLIARDAYSGTLLWKRPIDEWNTHLWPLKSGPNQLPRRLVAVGDRVYVTLGIDAPLEALDAATGKTIRTYAGTEHTDEVLVRDGTLFALVAQAPNRWKEYRPQHTYVWANTRRANSEWAWDEANRWLMSIGAKTGEVLWKRETRVAPLTLGVDGQRVYFYDGEKVTALDRASGEPLWNSEPVVHKAPFPTGYGPTLVVYQDVILLSVENRSMTAFSADDGRKLWTAPHHRGGHMSPDDMLVIDGLVWSGAVAGGGDSGVFTGRDVRTGEVKQEFPPDIKIDWFHHRCYRSRATEKYFIASRTGIEYIDLKAEHWDVNHWVRGGCLYGFMPANGLTYAPPHSCGCFLESKLFGLNALAADSPGRRLPEFVPDQGRLERGPAYSSLPTSHSPLPTPSDWPTYRHDAARSGATACSVPAELKRQWQVDLGGKLSSVVVAGGKVFLAAIDAHTVHALDAATGKPAWTFTAGGRIDSPPTVYQGRVLFGSTDGWVYALCATDGALAWRFRAAPLDRRLMAYDQLESVWPVSGSVLVEDGSIYCVAGRCGPSPAACWSRTAASIAWPGGPPSSTGGSACCASIPPPGASSLKQSSTIAIPRRAKTFRNTSRVRTCPWRCPMSFRPTAARSTCGPRRSTWKGSAGTLPRSSSCAAAAARRRTRRSLKWGTISFPAPGFSTTRGSSARTGSSASKSTATTAAGSGPATSPPAGGCWSSTTGGCTDSIASRNTSATPRCRSTICTHPTAR